MNKFLLFRKKHFSNERFDGDLEIWDWKREIWKDSPCRLDTVFGDFRQNVFETGERSKESEE